MKRLILITVLFIAGCQPCPAQDYPEYWKLPFFYQGSYGGITFPQSEFWFNQDSLAKRNLYLIPDTSMTKDTTFKSTIIYNTIKNIQRITVDTIANLDTIKISSKRYVFSSTINNGDTIKINAADSLTLDSLRLHINRDTTTTLCTATRSNDTLTITAKTPGTDLVIIGMTTMTIANITPSYKQTTWHSYGKIVIKNESGDSVVINNGFMNMVKTITDTLKINKGIITDSTAYVLKRLFIRNDSLFFIVNTDTFRLVKK